MKVSGTDECKWTAGGFGLVCRRIGGAKETETDVSYYDLISN